MPSNDINGQKHSAAQSVRHIVTTNFLNSRRNICAVNELVKTVRPKTLEELVEAFNQKSTNSLQQVGAQVRRIADQQGINLTDAEIQQGVQAIIIEGSFYGFRKEREAERKLTSEVPSLEVVTSEELDFDFGVDIAVQVAGTIIAGIQVKPQSYFRGTKGGLKQDSAANEAKYQKFQQQYGAPIIHLVYAGKKLDGFDNLPDVIKQVMTAQLRYNLERTALGQKSGIDFLRELTETDSGLESLRYFLDQKSKQRKG